MERSESEERHLIASSAHDFGEAIKERMLEKIEEKSGWRDPDLVHDIGKDLYSDAADIEPGSSPNLLVDIGARAMMLWYQRMESIRKCAHLSSKDDADEECTD